MVLTKNGFHKISGVINIKRKSYRRNNKIILEAANNSYDPIVLDYEQVQVQGRLLSVWRRFK